MFLFSTLQVQNSERFLETFF